MVQVSGLWCPWVLVQGLEPVSSMSLLLRFSPGMPGRGSTWHRASGLGPEHGAGLESIKRRIWLQSYAS